MDQKGQIVDAVLESVSRAQESDGRKQMTCTEAFKLARRFKVDVIEIGNLCNEHNIRICKCQLGCFT